MSSFQPGVTGPGVARDVALRRASSLTKWIGVGAVTLAAALAGYVAQAKPGHSTTSGSPGGGDHGGSGGISTQSTPPGSAGRVSSHSAQPSTSLNPPPAPPAPAPSPPTVVSGGS